MLCPTNGHTCAYTYTTNTNTHSIFMLSFHLDRASNQTPHKSASFFKAGKAISIRKVARESKLLTEPIHIALIELPDERSLVYF